MKKKDAVEIITAETVNQLRDFNSPLVKTIVQEATASLDKPLREVKREITELPRAIHSIRNGEIDKAKGEVLAELQPLRNEVNKLRDELESMKVNIKQETPSAFVKEAFTRALYNIDNIKDQLRSTFSEWFCLAWKNDPCSAGDKLIERVESFTYGLVVVFNIYGIKVDARRLQDILFIPQLDIGLECGRCAVFSRKDETVLMNVFDSDGVSVFKLT